MPWRTNLLALLVLILLPAAGASAAPQISPQISGQAALDSFAKNLGYRFTLLSNKRTDGLPRQAGVQVILLFGQTWI